MVHSRLCWIGGLLVCVALFVVIQLIWVKGFSLTARRQNVAKKWNTVQNETDLRQNEISRTTLKPVIDMYDVVSETCGKFAINNTPVGLSSIQKPTVKHSDRLLIIAFNFIHYEAIPFIEALYRPSFPNMLYCTNVPFKKSQINKYDLFDMKLDADTEGAETEDGKVRNLKATVSFHTTTRTTLTFYLKYVLYDFSIISFSPLETPYWCTEAGIRYAPHMRGYIYMADDTVFHHWKIKTLDPDKFWWHEDTSRGFYDLTKNEAITCKVHESGHLDECKHGEYWQWWDMYRNEMSVVNHTMQRYSKFSKACWKHLRDRLGGRVALPKGDADFYYVPQVFATKFLHLSQLMRVSRLWHEIAIAAIIFSLTKPSDIEVSDFYYNWNYYSDRKTPWTWYKRKVPRSLMVHPLKLGKLSTKDVNYTRLFCDSIFPISYKHVYLK